MIIKEHNLNAKNTANMTLKPYSDPDTIHGNK